MTPQQVRRARRLIDDLERLDHKPKAYPILRELRALLEPPLSLREIFDRVPGGDIKTKAETVGITRQAYYKIVNGQVRPQDETVRLLSNMSGVPIEAIRASCP